MPENNETRGVLIIILMVVCLGGGFFVEYLSWGLDTTDRIMATQDFAEAFELDGYKTVPVGDNSFMVLNFSDRTTGKIFGNVFIDSHYISESRFCMAPAKHGIAYEFNMTAGRVKYSNSKIDYLLAFKQMRIALGRS